MSELLYQPVAPEPEEPKSDAQVLDSFIAKLSVARTREECEEIASELENSGKDSEGALLLVFVASVLRAHYMAAAFSASDNDRVINNAGNLRSWAGRVNQEDPLVQKVIRYYNETVAPILASSMWMPSDYRQPEKWQI